MRTGLLLLTAAASLFAADLRFANLGDLKLTSGATIRNCKLGYPQPAIDFARKRNADTLLLGSNCGHLAPGCETARVNTAVRAFLE